MGTLESARRPLCSETLTAMSKSPVELAADVQASGLERDSRYLETRSIGPMSKEATPFYVAWTRTDITLIAALLGFVATYLKQILECTKLIAFLLFVIAVAVVFRR